MNMPVETQELVERDALEDLLPWYAAGTLNAADVLRVEEALKSDPDLMRHLDIAREEMGEVVLANQTLAMPSSKLFNQLMAKIEAEPQRKASYNTGILDMGNRLANWLKPQTLGWAAIAGAAIIAIQAGILGHFFSEPAKVYEMASTQPLNATQTGSLLLVSFTPTATAAQITTILNDVNAVIIDGPKAGGIYRLRLGDGSLSKPEIERIIVALRAKTDIIRFVGLGQ